MKIYNANQRSTAQGKLQDAIRREIRKGIWKGSKVGRKTFALLGYTVDELKAHLERQFVLGMSWENYGKFGWHVDHIIPLSSFRYETPDDPDFKRAWALENLQSLWAIDNWKKHNRISPKYQPIQFPGVVIP